MYQLLLKCSFINCDQTYIKRKNMNRDEILNELSPCGIDCSRCIAYEKSEIKKLSTGLEKALKGFDKMANNLAQHFDVYKKYRDFEDVLNALTQGQCKGCRTGQSMFPLCEAKTCFKEKKVDFCFQCDEYPCTRNKFTPEQHERWIYRNNFMKEKGVEAYYEHQKNQSRYS